MKRIKLVLIILVMFALCLCSACGPGGEHSANPTIENTPPTDINSGELTSRDYTQMWHRNGVFGAQKLIDIRTGYYGLEVSPLAGMITSMGALNDGADVDAQMQQRNSDFVQQLSSVRMGYSLLQDGKACNFIGMSAADGSRSASRLLESGTYMQRMDCLDIKFNGTTVTGKLEIAALPDCFTLEFALKDDQSASVTPSFYIDFGSAYSKFSQENNIVRLSSENHEGFVFILDDGVSASLDNGRLSFTGTELKLKKKAYKSMTVTCIPSFDVRTAHSRYTARQSVTCEAVQIYPRSGSRQDAEFDAHGYLSVNMNKMLLARTSDFEDEEKRTSYDRLSLTLTNNTSSDVLLPVQLTKTKNFGVEGMTAVVRDASTGEPVGVPVQTSKNWHAVSDDWGGTWYHGYTMLKVPAGGSITYEITIAYATWGGVYAASHAQLCLDGWGGGYQQWETSAVGSFGENFCYDMEQSHGTGAFINDVLPFLSYGQSGQKYTWSNGVSGGNFLVLYNKNGTKVNLKGMKSYFRTQGPCLTEVIYTGITSDNSIAVEYRINLARTNDAAKAMHTFKYTFLKDVEFSRMAFYAMGSDDYNVSYSRITLGNIEGPEGFSLGSESFEDGTISIGYSKYSGGYIGSSSQQRAEIGGDGLFALFSESTDYVAQYGRPGNRMLNLLAYKAVLNGKEYSKPAVSVLTSTANFGANNLNCAIVELSPQAEAGNTIKAGSTVEGTVEYIPMPARIGDGENGYYGDNAAMLALPEEDFALNLAMLFVKGDRLNTEVKTGELMRSYPIKIRASKGDTAAEFTVKGGTGYVAITVSGLSSYGGWTLQKLADGQWTDIDQSVHGADYWQCFLDVSDGTYELTYNVPHSGDPNKTYTYRLIKSK